MKKINSSILLFAFILFGFSSCVKQLDQVPPSSTVAGKFSEITAPDGFKWSTSNTINFSFIGSALNDYQMVLKVTDPEGTILIQKLQKANKNYKVVIEVPAHFETLTVSYGSITQDIDCKKGAVSITID